MMKYEVRWESRDGMTQDCIEIGEDIKQAVERLAAKADELVAQGGFSWIQIEEVTDE